MTSTGSSGDNPPEFDGNIVNYKDWRRRAELWVYSTRADPTKKGPRLLIVLKGSAWDACRHLEVKEVAIENGHEKIFSILDGLYGEPRDVVLIESLEEALYGTVRKSGEDYLSFMNKMDHRCRAAPRRAAPCYDTRV